MPLDSSEYQKYSWYCSIRNNLMSKDNLVPESLVCLNVGNTTCRKPAQGEGSDGQHIGTNSWSSLPSTKF